MMLISSLQFSLFPEDFLRVFNAFPDHGIAMRHLFPALFCIDPQQILDLLK